MLDEHDCRCHHNIWKPQPIVDHASQSKIAKTMYKLSIDFMKHEK